MTTALIVFAKAPVPGLAKSRLAPALGAEGAAALAGRMLTHTLTEAVAARLGPVTLCVTPDQGHPLLSAAAVRAGATLSAQGEGDLGTRMHRALAHALDRHPQAMLLGTDAPALDALLLRHAADALTDRQAVFVPTRDGGYALVGLRRADARWFEGMRWSHARVMADTRARLRAARVEWSELPALADIDTPEDLVHLPPSWLTDLPRIDPARPEEP